MAETPLVSVLINCYNSERYLAAALESVIGQSYQNWEVILWDNQSTDRTAAIAQGYGDGRIRYFRAPGHTPLGSARRQAIEKAWGEFVAILDSDDIWYPEKLRIQMERAAAMPNAGLIFSGYDVITADGTKTGDGRRRAPARSGEVFSALLTQEFTVCWPTVVFRKSALDQAGEFAPLRYLEDLEIMLRIADRSPFAYCEQRLAAYRIHPNQESMNYLGMRDEVLSICDDWERRWGGKAALTTERKATLSRARARAWSIAAKNAIIRGKSGLRMYTNSVMEAPTAESLVGLGASLFGPRVAATVIAAARRALGYGNL